MVTLVIAVYLLCCVAFYVQMMSHGRHHFDSEEPTAPTAKVIELFPAEAAEKKAA